MNAKNILPLLPNDGVFNKMSFREAVHSIYPDCTETSINWLLVTLRKQGSLASAGTGKYYRIPQDAPAKKQYSYPHSPEYFDLEKEITEARLPFLIKNNEMVYAFTSTSPPIILAILRWGTTISTTTLMVGTFGWLNDPPNLDGRI